MRRILSVTFYCFVFSFAVTAYGVDYAGYLSVIDEDYGYWEGRPMVVVDGERRPLDEFSGSSSEVVFELEHDLAQGLVRQFSPQEETPSTDLSASSSADAVAGGRTTVEPPSGQGDWVFLHEFPSFGFGQYEDRTPSVGLYCGDGASVWAWLASTDIQGLSPDDVADSLIRDANGMARLKLGCKRPMALS